MPRYPRPLALGLLNTAAHASHAERTRARIGLTLTADDEGYALIETYEIGGSPIRDDAAFAALEELAQRMEADAVVLDGDVDLARVRELAQRLRLVVVPVGPEKRPRRS